MFKDLFRSTPKWQSPKSQRRIEGIAELNPESASDAATLARLAVEDSEPAVRREAVKRLHDLDVLQQIQRRDLDASVREAAQQRNYEVLAGKCPFSPAVEVRIQRIRQISAPQTLVYLIKEGQPLDIKTAAVEQLSDEVYLEEIALRSGIARLRQLAAERISNPRVLETLANQSRHSDKSVYRIAKDKLDALHTEEKSRSDLQQRLLNLCEQMEHHARSAMNPLYKAKAESLLQQWQELALEADAPTAERFETAHDLVQQALATLAAEQQRKQDAEAAGRELSAACDTLEQALQELQQAPDSYDPSATAALIKTQQTRWEAAAELATADNSLQTRFRTLVERLHDTEGLMQAVQEKRDALEAGIAATQAAETSPDARAELDSLLASMPSSQGLPLPSLLRMAHQLVGSPLKESATPAATVDPARQQQLKARLEVLEKTIQEGNSKLASKKLHDIQQFMREHHLTDPALNPLVHRLEELKDWASYAVLPKKQALQAEMDALADKEMDPDAKADRIRALQNEWKALGVIDHHGEQTLWEKFKEASDRAYEPCREFFSAQQEIREQNLAKRQELCNELDAYLENPPDAVNTRQLDELLRMARQQWQSHYPVSRQHAQAVQGRFNKLMKKLETRLQDELGRHEATKRELIARAEALLTLTDTRAACDQAKQLQQEWKAAGAAHPRAERSLWQDFRKHCDALFARREAEFQARKTARASADQHADAQVHAMEKLVADVQAGNTEGMDIKNLSEQIQDAFRQLPREQQQSRRQRFEQARRQLENNQKRQRQEERENRSNDVVSAFALCAEADAAILRQTFEADAFAQSLAVINLKEPWQSLLQQRAQQIKNGSDDSTAANIEALCLDLEIFMDQPSPAHATDARRQRQMEMLQQKVFLGQESERQQRINNGLRQLLGHSLAPAPELWGSRIAPLLKKHLQQR